MPLVMDPITYDCTMPVGDTGDIHISVQGFRYDAVLFAIFDRSTGEDILRVPVDIDERGYAQIRLSNEQTRDLEPGRYKWNLRLVTDPERDEEGNIIAEDASDNVLTVFGPDDADIPDLRLVRNGGRV